MVNVMGAKFGGGASSDEGADARVLPKGSFLDRTGSFIDRMHLGSLHLRKEKSTKADELRLRNMQSMGNLLSVILGLSALRMRTQIACCCFSLAGLMLTYVSVSIFSPSVQCAGPGAFDHH